jgi:hypothetical protein
MKMPIVIEARLSAIGIKIPSTPARGGRRVECIRTGDLPSLSGKVPFRADGTSPAGKVGPDVMAEEAGLKARLAGLDLLAVWQRELGPVDRVAQVVKVIVRCLELFGEAPGQAGARARTEFGPAGLPGGMTIEVETSVQVRP